MLRLHAAASASALCSGVLVGTFGVLVGSGELFQEHLRLP